jgi:hypothetical protein
MEKIKMECKHNLFELKSELRRLTNEVSKETVWSLLSIKHEFIGNLKLKILHYESILIQIEEKINETKLMEIQNIYKGETGTNLILPQLSETTIILPPVPTTNPIVEYFY